MLTIDHAFLRQVTADRYKSCLRHTRVLYFRCRCASLASSAVTSERAVAHAFHQRGGGSRPIYEAGRQSSVSRDNESPLAANRRPIEGVKAFQEKRTPVFKGTRVPVQTLIDYLEAGDRLDDFLADYPTVTREQVVAALELAREALRIDARAS